MITTVHDLHFIQNDLYPLLALRSFNAQVDQRKFDVLKNGELIDQVETLEYESDVTLAQIGPFALVEMRYFGAIE